jgi:hypothetical protein
MLKESIRITVAKSNHTTEESTLPQRDSARN